MANNDEADDAFRFEYQFYVCLSSIFLKTKKPVECIIKFRYGLLSTEEKQYPPLTINPNESQDIPGHFVYTIPWKKESDFKTYLDENMFEIEVYEKDAKIGIAQVDLSPFFKNEVEEMAFGLKHRESVEIRKEPFCKENSIGDIDCVFILEKEECFRCKLCNRKFQVSTIMKHLNHPKVVCKESYSKEEITELEVKKEKRRRQKETQRQRESYDNKRRAEYHKKYYNSSKRAKIYQNEKEHPKSYNPAEEKVRAYDREQFERRQNQKNEFYVKQAKRYFMKCTLGIEHITLLEEVAGGLDIIKLEIDEAFSSLQNQTKVFARKSKGMKLLNDLTRLHESNLEIVRNKWKALFLKIEASFEDIADHLEEFNGHYGAWSEFGLLQMPMRTPCDEKKPCKLCRMATKSEKEKWEKMARNRNLSCFEDAMRYLNTCIVRFQQLEMPNENIEKVRKFQNEIEDNAMKIEIEIEKVVRQAKKSVLWKDVHYLYERILEPRWNILFGLYSEKNKKHLINEEWKGTFLRLELLINGMADHVEEYKDIMGCKYFGILKMPKRESCNEGNVCERCNENKIAFSH